MIDIQFRFNFFVILTQNEQANIVWKVYGKYFLSTTCFTNLIKTKRLECLFR